MKKISLDKQSKIPLHSQLYTYFKQKIEGGEIHENEFLPSEAELQRMFDVSRITVRRAIADLEHDGFVRKIRGKGTVVLPMRKLRDISRFSSFTEDAHLRGETPSSIILEFKIMPAKTKVAESLGLKIMEEVYYIKRLRLLNGKIIGIHNTYVSPKAGIELSEHEFDEKTSLYGVMEDKGIVFDCADETISARMPNNELRRELYMDDNVPVIYRERLTFDSRGLAVEYSENYYIADRYSYKIHLVKVRNNK